MTTNLLNIRSKSPELAKIPTNSFPRLIDLGMLHLEASLAGFAERYGRGETSHTIHVWWARRPHSAMRALVFASLCKDQTDESLEILKKISVDNNPEEIEKAKTVILSKYPDTPRVLDMFGGGGTIALEASNLGAQSYSIDSNQLSVFIQKCNLIYSQNIDRSKILSIIKKSGERILQQLYSSTDILFPLRETEYQPIAYIWTYSTKCEKCGYKYYLSKRRWLSKKKEKNIALILENAPDEQRFEIGKVSSDIQFETNWNGRTNNRVTCPCCGKVYENISIKKCNDELVALVKNGKGKTFLSPIANALPSTELMAELEKQLLRDLNVELPKTKLPKWSGIVNPALYGIETHSDFMNRRQRLVLLLLIKGMREEYFRLKCTEGDETAKYAISILSGLIDQLVDWNCRLSIWIPQNEQVGRAFCGPGIPMYWDYAEIDPVLYGPANLWGKLDRILSGIRSIDKFDRKPIVMHSYAQQLPFGDEYFDAIITDPPYYDNIYYTVLSDFFYVWKRLVLSIIDEELFADDVTDSTHELVASTYRQEAPEKAHEDYCEQFRLTIKEAERVLKQDGIFSLIYSHSSIKGWDAIVKSYRESQFVVTSIQPLSIERKQRPRAMTSEAVNTCITLVARKTTVKKMSIKIEELLTEVKKIAEDFAMNLTKLGWSEEDAGLTAFANGVGLLCNFSYIEGVNNDEEALKRIGEVVNELFPKFKIKNRKSL